MSARKIPAWRRVLEVVAAPFQGVELPPRVAWWVRFLRVKVFAVLVAIVAFSASLDRDKLRERLESGFSQDPPAGIGMDVKAGDLSLSFLLFRMKADNVILRSRPLRATDKPARFVLDEIKVGVGPIGALFGRPTYDFAVSAFGGLADGKIALTKTDVRYKKIHVEDMRLGDIQGLQSAIGGLPLDGTVEGTLDLDAPNMLLGTANGSLELQLASGALGDGKAKLVVPGDPFLSAGVTVPRIKLGEVVANVTIDKGHARIDAFRAHSADLDLTIEGFVELRDPFTMSQLHLFIRFKPSDDLLKREPTLGLVTTGLQTGKRGDGFFGAQLTGSMSAPRFEPNRSPPAGVTSKFESGASGPPPPAPTPPAPAPAPTTIAAPPPAPVVAAPPPAVDAAQAPAPPAPPETVPASEHLVPSTRLRSSAPVQPVVGPPPGPAPSEEGAPAPANE